MCFALELRRALRLPTVSWQGATDDVGPGKERVVAAAAATMLLVVYQTIYP